MMLPEIENRPPTLPPSPPVALFLPVAALLIVFGWGGIGFLLIYMLPTLGPRWLGFFFLVLGITGLFLPIMAFLNVRFSTKPPATVSVVVRQALWFGVYGATLTWLQIGRVLSSGLAIFLGVGFIAVEMVFLLRERTRWKP